MSTLEEKRNELQELERKALYEKWEVYLDKIKIYMDSLVGRTFMTLCTNTSLQLYRFKSISEKYHMDREGFYGQWSPRRYFEIETTDWISIGMPTAYSKRESPGQVGYFPSEYVFQKRKGLSPVVFIAKLLGGGINLSDFEVSQSQKVYVGKEEYDKKEYTSDPSYNRAMDFFYSHNYLLPECSILNDAKEVLAQKAAIDLQYFEKYKNILNNPSAEGVERFADYFNE